MTRLQPSVFNHNSLYYIPGYNFPGCIDISFLGIKAPKNGSYIIIVSNDNSVVYTYCKLCGFLRPDNNAHTSRLHDEAQLGPFLLDSIILPPRPLNFIIIMMI